MIKTASDGIPNREILLQNATNGVNINKNPPAVFCLPPFAKLLFKNAKAIFNIPEQLSATLAYISEYGNKYDIIITYGNHRSIAEIITRSKFKEHIQTTNIRKNKDDEQIEE